MPTPDSFTHPAPKHWPVYEKSMCKSCWASCCHAMPVEASVPDLIRLGMLTAEEAAHSLARTALRLIREGRIYSYRPRKLLFVLAQRPNRDCTFLDENRRCSVYHKRPEICRQFPKIGPRPGHCPYRSK